MAMIILAAPFAEINGQVGGTIYRVDQSRQHAQAYPRVISRKESSQQRAFTQAKNAWSSHDWTQKELDDWWRYCYRHPKKNKKGEVLYWHPFLAFLSVNTKRLIKGLPIVFEAPRW